jgi:hypothetical protein
MDRRDFLKLSFASTLFGPTLFANSLEENSTDYFAEGLQQTWEQTTLHHCVKPVNSFFQNTFGLNTYRSSGETMTVRNDLVGNVSLSRSPKSLTFFHQITDTHVIDEESPARFVGASQYLEKINIHNAFRKQEDLTLQVLDSMVNTINNICASKKLDFVLNTGDSVDNAQKNELSWFLRTMQGREVDPDSGINEDPLPGANNDANDPFIAHGLLASIPWYTAIGNHDILIQGNIPPHLLKVFNGIVGKLTDILTIPDPVGDYSHAIITPWVNPPEPKNLPRGYIVPDALRRNITPEEFISMHRQAGCGLPKNFNNSQKTYYTFYPKAGLPLKVIVLDTALRIGTAMGGIDKKQFNDFLVPELEKSKKNNELVMIVSHHPSSQIKTLTDISEILHKLYGKDEQKKAALNELLTEFQDEDRGLGFISGSKFKTTLLKYPNVFAHIAGHRHRHQITRMGSDNAGYWEIQTCSMLGYPQQSRLFEIVYEGNNIGAIHTCAVDHDSAPDSLAARSRTLSYNNYDKRTIAEMMGTERDRNSILRFNIPANIAKKL